jgi:hypothetical protein
MNINQIKENDPGDEMNADISPEERHMLDESFLNSVSRDNENLKRSELDDTDADGLPLNEEGPADHLTGDGLDIPGTDLDDELIGEEDEENNGYSEADTE